MTKFKKFMTRLGLFLATSGTIQQAAAQDDLPALPAINVVASCGYSHLMNAAVYTEPKLMSDLEVQKPFRAGKMPMYVGIGFNKYFSGLTGNERFDKDFNGTPQVLNDIGNLGEKYFVTVGAQVPIYEGPTDDYDEHFFGQQSLGLMFKAQESLLVTKMDDQTHKNGMLELYFLPYYENKRLIVTGGLGLHCRSAQIEGSRVGPTSDQDRGSFAASLNLNVGIKLSSFFRKKT